MTTAFVNTMITTAVQLYIWECPDCGVTYGIPTDFADSKRENGGHYFCPNGHRLSWHETEAAKAKRQLKYAQDRAAALQANLDQTEAERRAWKGQTTRLKNRAHAGLCAFCRRHFTNVAAHMATEHPEPIESA